MKERVREVAVWNSKNVKQYDKLVFFAFIPFRFPQNFLQKPSLDTWANARFETIFCKMLDKNVKLLTVFTILNKTDSNAFRICRLKLFFSQILQTRFQYISVHNKVTI